MPQSLRCGQQFSSSDRTQLLKCFQGWVGMWKNSIDGGSSCAGKRTVFVPCTFYVVLIGKQIYVWKRGQCQQEHQVFLFLLKVVENN